MTEDVIIKLQDLTYLNWSTVKKTSGAGGRFLKAYQINNKQKEYFKFSSYNIEKGIVGHESVNEIVVCRLLKVLGIDRLDYQLINARVVLQLENNYNIIYFKHINYNYFQLFVCFFAFFVV